MKKRLKDVTYTQATIKIERMVAQYRDNISTQNKTIGYLIDVKLDGDRGISFREDNPQKLWEELKQCIFLSPKEEELLYEEYFNDR